jgi:hypothetical protein
MMLRSLAAMALVVTLAACGGRSAASGDGLTDAGSPDAAPEAGPPEPFDPATVATSPSTPPSGIWSMSVQYGPVGQAVTPTIPMQVEMRADFTAYAWVCAGAPDDGSVTHALRPAVENAMLERDLRVDRRSLACRLRGEPCRRGSQPGGHHAGRPG